MLNLFEEYVRPHPLWVRVAPWLLPRWNKAQSWWQLHRRCKRDGHAKGQSSSTSVSILDWDHEPPLLTEYPRLDMFECARCGRMYEARR